MNIFALNVTLWTTCCLCFSSEGPYIRDICIKTHFFEDFYHEIQDYVGFRKVSPAKIKQKSMISYVKNLPLSISGTHNSIKNTENTQIYLYQWLSHNPQIQNGGLANIVDWSKRCSKSRQFVEEKSSKHKIRWIISK